MRARAVIAAWAAVAACLAAALAWRAVEAHRANAGLYRRLRGAEAELSRQRAQGDRLRRELQALQGDPVYVESILRDGGGLEAGERAVGPKEK